MSVTLKWYGSQVKTRLRGITGKRVRRAVIFLASAIKKELGRSQPTRGVGAAKVGLDPSRPGEYPKKVMGHLRRGIAWEYDAGSMTGRVGTNVEYGKFLELGTRKMARRPWLSKGLKNNRREIIRILKRRG